MGVDGGGGRSEAGGQAPIPKTGSSDIRPVGGDGEAEESEDHVEADFRHCPC